MSVSTPSPLPDRPVTGPAVPDEVGRSLDRVGGRIRRLYLLAGVTRMITLTAVALMLAYAVDRWLHLPVAVRFMLLAAFVILMVREFVRRVWRPVFPGPSRLETARSVERVLPRFEGRLISALQFGGGPAGSLEARVAAEAEEACREADLGRVLDARASLRELYASLGAVVLAVGLATFTEPALDVFGQRWLMSDVSWPRDTHFELLLPPRGPAHVVLEDGTVLVSRGGVVDVRARATGIDPARAELVVDTARGERSLAMTRIGEDYRGHVSIERDDVALFVRGGDDPGDDTRISLQVVDPPRLSEPLFVLDPPAYLGTATSTVGSEGLVVSEGTRVSVQGVVSGEVNAAELWLLGSGERIDMAVSGDSVSGTFQADASDSLAVVLTGPHGLQTPDPSHHALLVRPDRPPTLRVFSPPRSTVKVTSRAVVPFAVVAEDDHGVAGVELSVQGRTESLSFIPDGVEPTHHRLVIDLAEFSGGDGSIAAYDIEARDRRDLPGRGPQSALSEGRRVDVVEVAEVQRLLADRQLRLKEAYQSIRDRQQRVTEMVADMAAELPAPGDPDLVSAVVAQNQVTVRLQREARELGSVVNETILNRLDSGPGAEALLLRRLEDWASHPVDETFTPEGWRDLAAENAEGQFGRLDLAGRLLDMLAVALELSEDLSPRAHELLDDVRSDPEAEAIARVAAAQADIEAALVRLLGRMDEWEDYQEVLTMVRSLIEDQRRLRQRTESVLREDRTP